MILEAQSVRALNLDPAKMTCKQLSAILKALKTKEDTALPTKKADLFKRYDEWKNLPTPPMLVAEPAQNEVEGSDGEEVEDEADVTEDSDVIDAMLALHQSAMV